MNKLSNEHKCRLKFHTTSTPLFLGHPVYVSPTKNNRYQSWIYSILLQTVGSRLKICTCFDCYN